MFTTATLLYTVAPVPPVTQSRLNAAVSAVDLDLGAIQDQTGCRLVSDTTANSGGSNVTRTIVFGLPVPVAQQFNGNDPLPNNSDTKQWYVVTTSGGTATIGALLFDDGSGSGPVTIIPASINNMIVPNIDFIGGTIALDAKKRYLWTGVAWVGDGIPRAGAFQSNFPNPAGQATPFKHLYTHALGGALGSVITTAAVALS